MGVLSLFFLSGDHWNEIKPNLAAQRCDVEDQVYIGKERALFLNDYQESG